MNRKFFFAALIWYTITAYFSIGYFHPDEQYQIIEFAGLLEGYNSPDDLAWEYGAELRPALQPVLCYNIFNLCEAMGISDPYHKAFALRWLTGILAVFVIYFFTKSCKKYVFNRYWGLFLFLSYFLWFIPFLNVRFSSEGWSSIALIGGLTFLLQDTQQKKHFLLAGICFGLSFVFRYQMALCAVGIVVWFLFIKKERLFPIVLIILGGLIAVGIGVMTDSWFYGDFVFTPWNYFRVNLLEGKAKEFGTEPWFYYLYLTLRYAFLPVGFTILVSFFLLFYKQPKNIFLWAVLPLFIVQSIIAHKELRFLFPLANFVPIVFILALQEAEKLKVVPWFKKLTVVILKITFVLNIVGVIVCGFKPVGVSRIYLAEQIQNDFGDKPILVLHNPGDSPYRSLPSRFYLPENVSTQKVNFENNHHINTSSQDTTYLFVTCVESLEDPAVLAFIEKHNFVQVSRSAPEYVFPFFTAYSFRGEHILHFFAKKAEQER